MPQHIHRTRACMQHPDSINNLDAMLLYIEVTISRTDSKLHDIAVEFY